MKIITLEVKLNVLPLYLVLLTDVSVSLMSLKCVGKSNCLPCLMAKPRLNLHTTFTFVQR